MIRIGVTGGIGSGKSTVCAVLAGLGVPVYDSDGRARGLMDESMELRRKIVALLGEETYRGDTLDRAFVAGKVFGDKSTLASLEGIIHPAVAEDFETWAGEMEAQAAHPCVVLESAILFESGFDRLVDRVVTVSAPEEVRLERIVSSRHCSRREAMARMASQMTDAERESRADYVIENSGGREELAAAVENLYKLLKQ